MELKEKVAYIKGLMEGMEYDVSTKEGKLMAAVVETLDMMAAKVEEIDTDVDQLDVYKRQKHRRVRLWAHKGVLFEGGV